MNRTRNTLTGEIRNFHAGGDTCLPAYGMTAPSLGTCPPQADPPGADTFTVP